MPARTYKRGFVFPRRTLHRISTTSLHEHQHQVDGVPAQSDGGEKSRWTCSVSTPTFVTPTPKPTRNCRSSLKNAHLPFRQSPSVHMLDLIMQTLWTKRRAPFEAPYFSCVPYLLARSSYAVFCLARSTRKTPIPRLPIDATYLRDAMVALCEGTSISFAARQTDPHSCRSKQRRALARSFSSLGVLRIPGNKSFPQTDFARRFSYSVKHREHRPWKKAARGAECTHASSCAHHEHVPFTAAATSF